MQYLRTKGRLVYFQFECESLDCNAEGQLGVYATKRKKRITCPEECGALYAVWDNAGVPDLMCVVKQVSTEEVTRIITGWTVSEDEEDSEDASCDDA